MYPNVCMYYVHPVRHRHLPAVIDQYMAPGRGLNLALAIRSVRGVGVGACSK